MKKPVNYEVVSQAVVPVTVIPRECSRQHRSKYSCSDKTMSDNMYDFNRLEVLASMLIKDGRTKDAIRIYLFMADGDPSLDAGYLGIRLAQCYENLDDLDLARYWFGRAIEENPEVSIEAIEARKRLGPMSIADLLDE
jgi:tetratricopeptide (TPR) repeat protein